MIEELKLRYASYSVLSANLTRLQGSTDIPKGVHSVARGTVTHSYIVVNILLYKAVEHRELRTYPTIIQPKVGESNYNYRQNISDFLKKL